MSYYGDEDPVDGIFKGCRSVLIMYLIVFAVFLAAAGIVHFLLPTVQ